MGHVFAFYGIRGFTRGAHHKRPVNLERKVQNITASHTDTSKILDEYHLDMIDDTNDLKTKSLLSCYGGKKMYDQLFFLEISD